jgi:GxxExxY protein
LEANGIKYENQVLVPVIYKGNKLGDHRLDILVEGQIIIELKAVERIEPVFKAQLLSYLKMTGKKLGLLINFNVPVLKDGITRIIL